MYNPLLKKIERYKKMGLNNEEVGKLVDLTSRTVRAKVRNLEKMGRLAPPASLERFRENLVASRQAAALLPYNPKFVQ